MKRSPRRLRHWKQKYDKNAKFIWSRDVVYSGQDFVAGDIIPDGLVSPTKLRRLWESKWIQLADFDAPDVLTGTVGEYQKVEETEPEDEKDQGEDQKVEETEPEDEKVEDDSWLDGDEADEG